MSQLTYNDLVKEDLIPRTQVLNSLVINTPYKFDGYTSAPKIAKVFTLPFGIRANTITILRAGFQFVFSASLFMVISSFLIMSLYLPLQNQNVLMLKNAKSLTNYQFSLEAKLQEASSYTKLFSNADNLSLVDSEQILRVNSNSNNLSEEKQNLITINKYPSLQFSGF